MTGEKYEEEQNRVHRPHQHIQRAHPLGSLGRWYRTSKLRRILHTTNIMLAIALYGAIGFVWIIYDETFPIWARLSNTEGGLNFEPNDVGLAVAVRLKCFVSCTLRTLRLKTDLFVTHHSFIYFFFFILHILSLPMRSSAGKTCLFA